MGAHLPHLLGKLPHRLEQATIFKVAEDLVPVLQSAEIVDLLVEQPGYQFALFPTAGNRLNDLIEVEVGDEGTVCRVLAAGLSCRILGQQAGESPRRVWRERRRQHGGATAGLARLGRRAIGHACRVGVSQNLGRRRRLQRLLANRLGHVGCPVAALAAFVVPLTDTALAVLRRGGEDASISAARRSCSAVQNAGSGLAIDGAGAADGPAADCGSSAAAQQ
ncbi:MAG: hypothetical protein ACLPUO_13420 [Streptosporangiaceae bacterium]|jgi:hypothetical protein